MNRGKVPVPCLDCDTLTSIGSRCATHMAIYMTAWYARKAMYADPVYRAISKEGICHICGKDGANSRDHVIPLSKGGTNDPSNIKPAHLKCNLAKSDKIS